jgi:hypothetical protein
MIAFRIQGIPAEWSREKLTFTVMKLCNDSETQNVQIQATLTQAANPNLRNQVAVVQFLSAVPEFLQCILGDKAGESVVLRQFPGDITLRFDRNFLGMTPLCGPADDSETSIE